MSDSNAHRGPATVFYHSDLDEKLDLVALVAVTGESGSSLLRRAFREYCRQRVRSMKPSTAYAERLIERYGNKKESI